MTAVVRGFGAPPRPAVILVERLSTRQRLARAGAVLGIGLAAAAVALPIPLVHFVLVPASILAGAALAVHRLGQREIVRGAEADCPFCGTHQQLGLAGRSLRLPRRVHCSRCGRELELEPARRPSPPQRGPPRAAAASPPAFCTLRWRFDRRSLS